MDLFEGHSKKQVLEDLTKEELLNKYKGLLVLAQKAKQARDTLINENGDLKKSLCDLENSKEQVRTLTDQNSKLASDLSTLEAQIEELKTIGLTQQEQLLSLEKLKDVSHEAESDLGSANEKLKEKLKLYHSKIVKFAQDVKHLRQTRQDLLATFGSYVSQVSDWKNQLETLLRFIEGNQKETQALRNENSTLRGYFEALAVNSTSECQSREPAELHANLDQYIQSLQARNSSLENEVSLANENRSKLEETIKSLISECGQSDLQLLKKYGVEFESHETKEDDACDDLSRLASVLRGKIKTSSSQLSIIQQLETKLAESDDLKRENAELLAEMNEMNDVLKERGETISKQQAFCDKLIDTVNQKEDLIKTLQRELQSNPPNHHTADISQDKDKLITDLKSEIETLRSQLLNTTGQLDEGIAESESMSVSTMSRNEDLNRMKDLESSWEERYGKLRTLALKLKRKTTDLSAELTKEQAEKAEVQQKLNKTISTFQQQMDRVQDDLEACKTENRTHLKKIESLSASSTRDKHLLATSEDLVAKLKSELEVLTREKGETENWKKQVSSKVQTLKNELKANAVLKKDFETKLAKLTSELEVKEKALKLEGERHAQTKSSLQESADECKRLSLLILELRDYEQVAKDISHDLDKKQEIITGLKNQADGYKANLTEVQAQNKQLEDEVKSLTTSIGCAKSESDLHVNKISELEKLLLERDLRLQSLSHAVENSKLENEDLTRQLSDAMVDHEKLVGSLKTKEDQLKSQNLGLEQKLRGIQETLKLREDELSEVRGDYECYKIRAKSFMQQSRDFGTEEKLMGETSRLKEQVEELKDEVKELRCAVEQEKEKNDKLTSRNCQMLKQNETMQNDIDDYKRQHEKLQTEHQSSITEHSEAIRTLKLHTEKLTEYYQQQLSDQETRHSIEITELQTNVSKALSPSNMPLFAPPSMMIREEGEGSENADGSNTSNTVNPLSLEKLLSSESDKDTSVIRKQLSENETKVSHLTALLADAEQDLAKHVQMNKVLKEEIRRQQRCVERDKHAENMEYLKNVVLKFLTLGNGDERTRLLPVLNTILKLSPEENRKLMSISKGDRSWSSYLPGGWGS